MSTLDLLACERLSLYDVRLRNAEGVICIVIELVSEPIFSRFSRNSVDSVLTGVISALVVGIVSSHGPETFVSGGRGQLDNTFSRVLSNTLLHVSGGVVNGSEGHLEGNLFRRLNVCFQTVNELDPLATSIFINHCLHFDCPKPLVSVSVVRNLSLCDIPYRMVMGKSHEGVRCLRSGASSLQTSAGGLNCN